MMENTMRFNAAHDPENSEIRKVHDASIEASPDYGATEAGMHDSSYSDLNMNYKRLLRMLRMKDEAVADESRNLMADTKRSVIGYPLPEKEKQNEILLIVLASKIRKYRKIKEHEKRQEELLQFDDESQEGIASKNWLCEMFIDFFKRLYKSIIQCGVGALDLVEHAKEKLYFNRKVVEFFHSISNCSSLGIEVQDNAQRNFDESLKDLYSESDAEGVVKNKADNDDSISEEDVKKAARWLHCVHVYSKQFYVLRISLAVLHFVVFQLCNIFDATYLQNNFGILFETFEAVIMTFAFWAVEHFMADGANEILKLNDPFWKCFSINFLVTYVFIQQILLQIGVFIFDSFGDPVGCTSDQLQYFLVCVEMFAISVLQMYIYTVKEWQIVRFKY
jgi:hypothetical protein